ncbi:MAG: hypothetical protein ACRDEA_04875 [Microcystaceae cyanobacterium]
MQVFSFFLLEGTGRAMDGVLGYLSRVACTRTSTVAKRRNLKKEKAERNRAYARQFRRQSSRFSSTSRTQRFSSRDKQQAEDQSDGADQ